MPVHSKAQMRAMQAAAHGDSKIGIPKDVAEDYVEASHGMDMDEMPEHVPSVGKMARHGAGKKQRRMMMGGM